MNKNILRNNQISPSEKAMERTYTRSFQTGGATLEFSGGTENIREVSRKIGFDVLSDATYLYVPTSIAEGFTYCQDPIIRNIIKFSEEFDNAYWSKDTNVSVSGNTIANPINGLVNADLVTITGNSQGAVYKGSAVNINTTYTISFWIRNNPSSSNLFALFTNGNINYSINLTNSWVYHTFKFTSSSNQLETYIEWSNRNTLLDNSFYLWGAQLELGPIATVYQRTTDGITNLNFTRNTSATVTNKQGFIEDSCYNVLLNSDNFNGANWLLNNATLSSKTQTDLFNRPTTFEVYDVATNAQHNIYSNNISFITGTIYTGTIYVKKTSSSWIYFWLGSSPFGGGVGVAWANFNFDTGLFGFKGPAATCTSKQLANGWWELSITAQCTLTITSTAIVVQGGNNTNSNSFAPSYVGTGASMFLIAGMQLAIGSVINPFIKTTNRLNVPRLDYSRLVTEPSLLMEPQATNLALQSETYTSGTWIKTNATVTPTATIGPFGTNNASLITATANAGTILQNVAGTTANFIPYSYSAFIKNNTASSIIQLGVSDNVVGSMNLNYSVANDTFSIQNTGSWSDITASITNLSNGWKLFKLTGVKNSGAIVTSPSISPILSGESIYVGGVQVEVGVNRTTYIPTTTASVTRNAENSYVDLSNNNMLNKNNWTLYLETYLYDFQIGNITIALSDTTGTGGNTNQIGYSRGFQPTVYIATSPNLGGTTAANNTFNRLLVKYDGVNAKFFLNGVLDYTIAVPVFDYKYLVINNGSSNFSVDKAILFNRTLSDLECRNITTSYNTFESMAIAGTHTVII